MYIDALVNELPNDISHGRIVGTQHSGSNYQIGLSSGQSFNAAIPRRSKTSSRAEGSDVRYLRVRQLTMTGCIPGWIDESTTWKISTNSLCMGEIYFS